MNSYDQFLKQEDRHLCIKKAVECLTQNRENACCVKRNYVRDIYDFFTLTEDESTTKAEALKININDITNWEKLHDSFIGKKSVSDLSVCYLAGPEPLNDYTEFINLGILPQNIWSFEMDNSNYAEATRNASSLSYPMPRVINQKLENFLHETPKKFDIIYVDACGSIPSNRHALKCISAIFDNQRINSPGVVISNFAEPDEQDYLKFNQLILPYLYFKSTNQCYQTLNETIEGLTSKKAITDFEKFRANYSDFISAVMRDIPSVYIPLKRMSYSSYLRPLFDENKQSIKNFTLPEMYEASKESSLARFIIYCKSLRQLDERTEIFFKEIVDLDILYKSFCLETLIRNEKIRFPHKMQAASFLSANDNLFQFLDKPHGNIFMDVVINQLVYPMHYVSSENVRYMYKAKNKWMYSDVTVYDECRYIYEWLPTVSLMKSIKDQVSPQYVFRYAIDGLIKQREQYNNEFFYQGAVISGNNNDEFSIKRIPKRVNLNERR